MTSQQLEVWVLSLVDQVVAGRHVEDSRVELKASWVEAKTAARRIAGHANAAKSDSILWVIGLDEARGVVAVSPTDLAIWLPQVTAEFDGVAPALTDLVVPTPSGTVVALLFDVSRRPFVVKNPVFGITGGGAVSLEVPWREGTTTRTARRDEVLRILVPRQVLPSVELLQASAEVNRHDPVNPGYGGQPSPIEQSQHLRWSFDLALYVTPSKTELLVLPTHKASLKFQLASEDAVAAVEFRFYAPYRSSGTDSVSDSSTVKAGAGEAVLTGPGLLHARASHHETVRELPKGANISAILALSPAGNDLATEVAFRLVTRGEQGDYQRSWGLEEKGAPST